MSDEERRPKAADVPDELFLRTMLGVYEDEHMWTNTWHLEKRIPGFPPKVLRAKAAQLIKRNLIQGCACGCRGDFELLSKGMDFLADRGVKPNRLRDYSNGRSIPWAPRPTNADRPPAPEDPS